MTVKDILEQEHWVIPWKATNTEMEAAELVNSILRDIINRIGHLEVVDKTQ